jgi:6-pyruvoyltetrahydropterin/6-carboxytetrahydropterin synthase
VRIRRSFEFEAAHHLPLHPGKCRSLHGHSYRLVVSVERSVDPVTGMALDFAELKAAVRDHVVDVLDHRLLNDIMDNPTAEVIARWIWGRLEASLPGLAEVELFETSACSVVYRGD